MKALVEPVTMSPFDDKGIQWAWNSSSIGLAETCLRKYQLRVLKGWSPSGLQVHLWFGGHYATAIERYHKLLATGMDREDVIQEIVRLALIDTWNHEYTKGKKPKRKPGTGKPIDSLHNAKTRENLIRSIVWYCEKFKDDKCKVITLASGKPAAELSSILHIDETISFCAHMDQLVEYGGEEYVMDQKAQPLKTHVLGEKGWRKIGELVIDDSIYGCDGKLHKITALHPKGITATYEVTFNDDSSVLCGEDHLWAVKDNYGRASVLSLKQLLSQPPYKKYSIPLIDPIQHPRASLPLHPYVLGVLLGDGYLNGNSIQLSTSKDWLVQNVAALLPLQESINKVKTNNLNWTISGGSTLNAIKELKLKGILSGLKFIPNIYLLSSEQQRRELLRGLLDTDGSWNGKSRIYDSTSPILINDICELVRSLGGTARYRNRNDGCYRASLRLPELPTGVGRRYIVSIKQVDDCETMCIEIDAPDHLYVTEHYIVTHNTTKYTLAPKFFADFNPNTQMSMYTFMGQSILSSPIKGVIIDAAQIAVGFTRFERGFTHRTKGELNEWFDDAMYIIETARHATREKFFPKNTSACGNYGGCEFRHICGRDPEHREKFLRADFIKKPMLNPLEKR